jgi:hypothetical protein
VSAGRKAFGKGDSPEPAGWLLEARGDARPRGMIAIAGEETSRRNRTRLTNDVDPSARAQKPRAFGFCGARGNGLAHRPDGSALATLTSMVRVARVFGLSAGLAAVVLTSTACAAAPGPSATSAREHFSRELYCPLNRVRTTLVVPMARPPDKIAKDPERLEMWLDAAHKRTANAPEPKYRVIVRGCDEELRYTCWERYTLVATRHGLTRVPSMSSCIADEPPPAPSPPAAPPSGAVP